MSEMKDMIAESAHRLFGDLIDHSGTGAVPSFPGLSDAIEENGFARVLNSEAMAGAGGDWDDAGVVIRASGYHAVPVPLPETILANYLLEQAGTAPLEGLIAVSVEQEGSLSPAPVSEATHVLVVKGESLSLYPSGQVRVLSGRSMAGDANDRITGLPDTVLFSGATSSDAFTLMAAIRAGQLAGCMARVLDKTLAYSRERIQFGKPVSGFQAVQQQLAVLASEVAASQRAADEAFRQLVRGEGHAGADIAAARIRCGEAAETVGRLGHAIHGAIGITQDYALHHFTRRLWSWRGSFGNESFWAQRLGQAAFAIGGEALWSAITDEELRV